MPRSSRRRGAERSRLSAARGVRSPARAGSAERRRWGRGYGVSRSPRVRVFGPSREETAWVPRRSGLGKERANSCRSGWTCRGSTALAALPGKGSRASHRQPQPFHPQLPPSLSRTSGAAGAPRRDPAPEAAVPPNSCRSHSGQPADGKSPLFPHRSTSGTGRAVPKRGRRSPWDPSLVARPHRPGSSCPRVDSAPSGDGAAEEKRFLKGGPGPGSGKGCGGDREQAYCELEHVLGEEDSRPPCGVVNRLLAEVSQDLTAAQGVTDSVRMAASNVLVALARTHFSMVMAELQGHLKATREMCREMCKEFVLVTLSKLFSICAPQCISFVWLTLAGLCSVVGRVRSGRTLRTACAVVKQWMDGIESHLSSKKHSPWPATEKEQMYENLHELFFFVVSNWQDCKEEEDRQAVLGAVTAMMTVLLQEELPREHVWERLLWLVHPCQEMQDTCRVAKSLIMFLEALQGVQSVIRKDKFLVITSAVFYQLSDDVKQHSEADRAELTRCILLQARICPEETVLFLQSQLGDEWEAGCVAALGLLSSLARSDEPAMTEKLPQITEAVQRVCSDPRTRVRRAVLHFIEDLLSTNTWSCSAWDVVGHIFREFSRTTGRRAAGDLSAQEAQEEGALQELCMDILGSLDVSARGISKLLWPRLLLYVVPAQYTGMLIPVSRCVQALAKRGELTVRDMEDLDPHFLSSMFQGPLLTAQTLLARLLVVAGSPSAGSELQAAALLLLQNLHSKIHRAVGAKWAAEIPLLLQRLEVKFNSTIR
ncbi:maestro heat-like repeat-containing protein family member 2B [Lagopus muta]|uniref:maestro heat-like repeat-containing protein family member 2B n=1 Tax=Lagopus muta TaxID=64668 RepID=UPI0020A061C8|nr:maestro heat-like repeat-containing protein family member 2B [Lagopus muta]